MRTHTHQNTLARTRTHARRHTHDTHAPKHAHAHTHGDTQMTRAEGSTPPLARQPGKRGDSGGWAEERERRDMGYSASISAHPWITIMGKFVVVNRHDKQGKYMRNQSAVCMAHACMWTSRFVNVICVACCVFANMRNEPSRARARGSYVDHLGYRCRTVWHPLHVRPLPVALLLDHCCYFPHTCSNVSCWALGTALQGIRRIVDHLASALNALSLLLCALVEALKLASCSCHGSWSWRCDLLALVRESCSPTPSAPWSQAAAAAVHVVHRAALSLGEKSSRCTYLRSRCTCHFCCPRVHIFCGW